MYLCARNVNFASFYDFSIKFWNCSYGVDFFFLNNCISMQASCLLYLVITVVHRLISFLAPTSYQNLALKMWDTMHIIISVVLWNGVVDVTIFFIILRLSEWRC